MDVALQAGLLVLARPCVPGGRESVASGPSNQPSNGSAWTLSILHPRIEPQGIFFTILPFIPVSFPRVSGKNATILL